MRINRFVSGASILLVGWLGATFFNEVPAKRYPKLDQTAAAERAVFLKKAEQASHTVSR